MKQYFLALLFTFFCAYCWALDIQIETPYAVLMDAETGEVLFEKNGKARIFPASTMKLASILHVLENKEIHLDDLATVTAEALKKTSEQEKLMTNFNVVPYYLEPDGTMAYIRKNEKLSIRSLIYALLMKSANDASNVMAHHASGSIPQFVDELNCRMHELGLTTTHFVNPHGLHHPDHYSTAFDMAKVGCLLYQNQDFMELALQRVYLKPKTNFQKEEIWKNLSCLVQENSSLFYSKTLFAKTGFMKAAKYNLVAAASNGERTLVAALHKSPNWKQRYLDVIHMFESAFQEEKVRRTLFVKEETKFEKMLPKSDASLIAQPQDDISIEYFPSQEPRIEARLCWKDELSFPINQGEEVAQIELISKAGEKVLEVPLYATNKVSKKRFLKDKWMIVSGTFFFSLGAIFFLRRRDKKK